MDRFSFPFAGDYPITQRFGEHPEWYTQFGLNGHNGVDFGLRTGGDVLASADGQVEKVGYDAAGYGNYVKIRHDDVYQTIYGHLTRATVLPGQKVRAGDRIGYSGWSGYVIPAGPAGAHLHWELRKNGKAVDPLPHLTAIEDTTPTEDTTPAAGEPLTAGRVRVTASDGLNVRVRPGGVSVGLAPPNTELEMLSIEGEWAAVKMYVHRDWIEAVR